MENKNKRSVLKNIIIFIFWLLIPFWARSAGPLFSGMIHYKYYGWPFTFLSVPSSFAYSVDSSSQIEIFWLQLVLDIIYWGILIWLMISIIKKTRNNRESMKVS